MLVGRGQQGEFLLWLWKACIEDSLVDQASFVSILTTDCNVRYRGYLRATHNARTIGVVPQKRPRRRRYGTASYLAWSRPGAVWKALLSATGSFEDKKQKSQRQDKLSLLESGHRSCACPASVGSNRPANRPANRPLCRGVAPVAGIR